MELKARYFGPGKWASPECIRFLTLALAGEVGELANLVKKAWREGKVDQSQTVREELADIGIYHVMLAEALGVDLVFEIERKLKIVNARRLRSREAL